MAVTDDFVRADNADLGANWTPVTGQGAARIVSNTARTGAVGTDSVERYSGTTFANDQYAKTVVKVVTSGSCGVGVIVRAASGANSYYEFQSKQLGTVTDHFLQKRVAGAGTILATYNGQINANDTIEIYASGTAITAKVNGVTVAGPITDSALASGWAGISMFVDSGTTADAQAGAWEGGDIGGAAANPFVSNIGAQMLPRAKPNYSAFCGFVLGTALTLSQGVQQMPVGKQVGFVPAPTRTASMTTLTHVQARPPYYQDIKPFAQTEWPLPRLPGTLLSVTINIRPPLDTPAAVTLPFSQTDWPIPQAKPYPIALRTWTQDRKQYYADIQPFNQTHWPPGRAMPPAVGLSTATSAAQQGVLSLPVGGIPDGRQWLELPAPRVSQSPTLLTWIGVKQLTEPELPPGSPQPNNAWTLPLYPAPPPVTRLTHVSYYVYNTNLPSIPGTTFPLPYGKPYPIALRTWIQGTPRYYTDTVPFNQTDWRAPSARPRLRELTTWTQSLVLNTLSIVPGTPFVPVQWPVPVSRRPSLPPTWTQGLLTTTLGAPGWALLLSGERNRLVREIT